MSSQVSAQKWREEASDPNSLIPNVSTWPFLRLERSSKGLKMSDALGLHLGAATVLQKYNMLW